MRDNAGILSTGDGTTNIQYLTALPSLPPVGEVPPAPGPVGVPGIGLFVGRESELSRLGMGLTDGDVVVQALHGLGGIGKSSLAAQFVRRRGHRFSQVAWIIADSPANIDAGLTSLAVALEPQLAGRIPTEGLRERAVAWLCAHRDWLVVLDNVTDRSYIQPLLARATTGRFLITTRRTTGWSGIADPLPLDVLDPPTSRELISRVVGPELLDGVDDLCEYLGHLPLALDQAAAYMAETRVTAADYRRLLTEYPDVMFAEGSDAGRTIARVWSVTLDRLTGTPLCGRILRVIAWFAPTGIPRSLLADLAPEPALLRALGRLAAYGMIDYDGRAVAVHRLVQAVARLGDEPRIRPARATAIRLLRGALPGDPDDPAAWPAWRALAAHVGVFAERAEPDADDRDTSYVLNAVAGFHSGQGDGARAVAYFQRALDHDERTLGPGHANTLTARNNLAYALGQSGDVERVIPLYERTLADRERLQGADRPDTLTSRNNLASAYRRTGDTARAISLYERTLADRERLQGRDHPDTLTARNNLASAYNDAGDTARAVALHERVIADTERVLGPGHPSLLRFHNNLAYACYRNGETARASALYERTLADCERVLGAEHPLTEHVRRSLDRVRDPADAKNDA